MFPKQVADQAENGRATEVDHECLTETNHRRVR